MLKAKNKNVVDIIFNNKHAVKVYKGLQLVWQKIADLLHLTQVCGESEQPYGEYFDTTKVVPRYSLTNSGVPSSNTNYSYIEVSLPNGVYEWSQENTYTTTSVTAKCFGFRGDEVVTLFNVTGTATLNQLVVVDNYDFIRLSYRGATSRNMSIYTEPPSPSNPIEIKSVGDKTKNLFNLNGDITLGYRLNTTTGIGKKYGTMGSTNDFITDGAYCVSELMEIKPNTNYAKNTPATAYYRIHFYDSDKICVSVTNYSINQSPANAKYMAICLPIAELGNNIQVEENSKVTDYEPFGYKLSVDVNGTISTCYLEQPLRKVGIEWDEIYRDETGYHIERRIYEDTDSATKPMEQGLHLLDESIFEDVEWDVEPIIHEGDEITFLTEIQPSDYTIE